MGVVDEIIWEQAEGAGKEKETFQAFPVLKSRLHSFLKRSLHQLSSMVGSDVTSLPV
jgi:acetyl-CoA carboxylase alpha subunit